MNPKKTHLTIQQILRLLGISLCRRNLPISIFGRRPGSFRSNGFSVKLGLSNFLFDLHRRVLQVQKLIWVLQPGQVLTDETLKGILDFTHHSIKYLNWSFNIPNLNFNGIEIQIRWCLRLIRQSVHVVRSRGISWTLEKGPIENQKVLRGKDLSIFKQKTQNNVICLQWSGKIGRAFQSGDPLLLPLSHAAPDVRDHKKQSWTLLGWTWDLFDFELQDSYILVSLAPTLEKHQQKCIKVYCFFGHLARLIISSCSSRRCFLAALHGTGGGGIDAAASGIPEDEPWNNPSVGSSTGWESDGSNSVDMGSCESKGWESKGWESNTIGSTSSPGCESVCMSKVSTGWDSTLSSSNSKSCKIWEQKLIYNDLYWGESV